MADNYKDNKLRDRGIGTPEPVGITGERAGPSRPLASDCPAYLVGDQAKMSRKATGTKEIRGQVSEKGNEGVEKESDPFKKRPLVGRSPPHKANLRRGSTGSIAMERLGEKNKDGGCSGNGTTSNPEILGENISRDSKRKRFESPEEGKSTDDQGLSLQNPGKEQSGTRELMEDLEENPDGAVSAIYSGRGGTGDTEGVQWELLEELGEIVGKLCKYSEDLEVLVRKTPNTKAEIKHGIRRVSRVAETILERWKGTSELRSMIHGSISATSDIAVQNQQEGCPRELKDGSLGAQGSTAAKRGDSVSVAVQVCDGVGQVLPLKKSKSREVEVQVDMDKELELEGKLMEAISQITHFDEFVSLTQVEWPERCYRNTQIGYGHPLKVEGDIAVVVNKEDNEQKVLEKLKERYPDVSDVLSEGLNGDKVEFVQMDSNVTTSKGSKRCRSRIIYLIPYCKEESGVNDMEPLYGNLVRWKQLLHEHGRKNAVLITPSGIDRLLTRKCLEWILNNSGITVEYLFPLSTQRRQLYTNGGQELRSGGKKSVVKQEVIKIKQSGRSFADIVKTIKQELDVDKIGVNIKAVRKSGKEDLLLTIEGENKADIVKRELLRKNIQNLEVTTKSNTSVVLLYGVDPSIEEEALKMALSKETGLKVSEIEVSGLRPGRFGNKNATIIMPREAARGILKNRKMKIGWTICQIRERVPILRCYKCLDLGHKAYQCKKDVDRTKDCLNCGKPGHNVKDCSSNSYCIKCQKEGHRFDQMKCPIFRKMVLETRGRWANRK